MKPISTRSLVVNFVTRLALVAVPVLCLSCAGSAPSSENSSVRTANSQPTPSPSPTTMNSNNSTPNTPFVVDEKALATALKTQLMEDDKGKIISPAVWAGESWLKTPIGTVYKDEPDITVQAVVGVCVRYLKQNDRRLPKEADKRLRLSVKTTDTCETVVATMRSVSNDSVPLTGDSIL